MYMSYPFSLDLMQLLVLKNTLFPGSRRFQNLYFVYSVVFRTIGVHCIKDRTKFVRGVFSAKDFVQEKSFEYCK